MRCTVELEREREAFAQLAARGERARIARSQLTQTQWLDKANGVCTTLNAQTRALGPHPGPPVPGESNAHALQRNAAYLDRLVPLQVNAVAHIRALGSPPQNVHLVSQALTAFDLVNADFNNALAAGKAGNVKAYVPTIRRATGPDSARANATARRAGLTVCAAR